MGLDIYAGTLIRYYARNWKTVSQQFAEANGIDFQTIRPQQNSENEFSLQEIQELLNGKML